MEVSWGMYLVDHGNSAKGLYIIGACLDDGAHSIEKNGYDD